MGWIRRAWQCYSLHILLCSRQLGPAQVCKVVLQHMSSWTKLLLCRHAPQHVQLQSGLKWCWTDLHSMSSQVSVEDSPEMKSSVTHKLFRLSGPREPMSTKCLEYLRTRGVFAFSGHMQQVECCAHVNHVQHGVASPGKVESQGKHWIGIHMATKSCGF